MVVGLALVLTGCSVATSSTVDAVEAVSSVPAHAWEPVEVTPDSGCRISETGSPPGQTDADPWTAPAALTLTCGTTSTVLTGDFTHKTINRYDPATTRVRQVLMVGEEVRIWHRLRGEGCLTIQVVDDLDPIRDDCDTPAQQTDPAEEPTAERA